MQFEQPHAREQKQREGGGDGQAVWATDDDQHGEATARSPAGFAAKAACR